MMSLTSAHLLCPPRPGCCLALWALHRLQARPCRALPHHACCCCCLAKSHRHLRCHQANRGCAKGMHVRRPHCICCCGIYHRLRQASCHSGLGAAPRANACYQALECRSCGCCPECAARACRAIRQPLRRKRAGSLNKWAEWRSNFRQAAFASRLYCAFTSRLSSRGVPAAHQNHLAHSMGLRADSSMPRSRPIHQPHVYKSLTVVACLQGLWWAQWQLPCYWPSLHRFLGCTTASEGWKQGC